MGRARTTVADWRSITCACLAQTEAIFAIDRGNGRSRSAARADDQARSSPGGAFENWRRPGSGFSTGRDSRTTANTTVLGQTLAGLPRWAGSSFVRVSPLTPTIVRQSSNRARAPRAPHFRKV